jgi:hypothetical protein
LMIDVLGASGISDGDADGKATAGLIKMEIAITNLDTNFNISRSINYHLSE